MEKNTKNDVFKIENVCLENRKKEVTLGISIHNKLTFHSHIKNILYQLFQSAILMKLQSSFVEMTLRHGCSPVNLVHIFRTTFPKNTSGRLLLKISTLVKTPFLAEHLLEAILEHLLAATSKWLPLGGYFYGHLLVAHLYGSFHKYTVYT